MSELELEQLVCEYRTELLGTDCVIPRFGWKLRSEKRNTRQQAYRIQVADAADFSRPIWDSGRMESDHSIQVEYEGPALLSRTRYYYRVQVWDQFGRQSQWSTTEWWETAFLDSSEWQASWITPSDDTTGTVSPPVSMLRRAFSLKTAVTSARIYATAAGLYEIYLNGSRVGEEWLTPGWTSYQHRHQYQTYDVTEYLREGSNALGIQLADGWYTGRLGWDKQSGHYGKQRAVLLELHVRYEDGSEETVCTDASWKAAEGPILFSGIYDGELYDARKEQPGWSEDGFDDLDWQETIVAKLPYSQLVAQENWPVRVTEILTPQQVIHTSSGDTLLDMGQNMVGRVRLNLHFSAGTHLILQHAEVLDREGNFYTGNLRSAKQRVEYIAKAEGLANFASFFSFQGFRYVKIEGLSELTDTQLLQGFTGEVMHSAMEPTGQFQCSDERINQLQRNIVWGQRGNFIDVPTDCPQRDERLGWTGDAQVFIRTAAFNYQVAPFFGKWLRDLKADQRLDGSVPFVIPNILDGNDSSATEGQTNTSAAWGDAAVICPWTQYLCYGDERLLGEQYDSMKVWVEYIRRQGDNEYLWNTGFHFGDWLGLDAKENSYIGATPLDLIATSFYANSVRILRDAAVVLGKSHEVRHYSDLLNRIIEAFRREFVTPAGRLAAPTQTAHVLTLMFGLVEGQDRERTARELNDLVVNNKYHLTTGFVGTPYLCLVLSDHGYHDTAVRLLLQDNYPSWLYSVSQGATTIWEHWDGIKPDGTFWSDDMNSYNHYAYGAIGDWMYRYLAGLDMDETETAYKMIRIYPRFAGGRLTSASARLESPYGMIESSWIEEEGRRTLEVQIPVNTTARITLSGAKLGSLMESGNPLTDVEGIGAVEESVEGIQLTAGSGTYRFSYSLESQEV